MFQNPKNAIRDSEDADFYDEHRTITHDATKILQETSHAACRVYWSHWLHDHHSITTGLVPAKSEVMSAPPVTWSERSAPSILRDREPRERPPGLKGPRGKVSF